MNNKRKRTLIVMLVSVCCALAVFGGGYALSRTSAAVASLSENVSFKAVYGLSEQIDIPSATLTVGSESYDAQAKVIAPDGFAYAVRDNKYTALVAGKYTVVYYAVSGGKYYEAEREFSVSPGTFTFSGDKSSYYYGAHSVYATNKKGLVVNLAQGETLTFNRVVDLRDLDGDNIVRFFAAPSKEYETDARCVEITFTDAYDPNNAVTFKAKRVNYNGSWAENNVYCLAGATGQDIVGLEATSASEAVLIEGGSYRIHRDGVSVYGSPTQFTLSGYVNSSLEIGDVELGVAIDTDRKLVYSNSIKASGTTTKLVSALSNTLLNEALWEGFTSNEVFVSVSADNYDNSSVGLVFTYVGGQDLSEAEFSAESVPLIKTELPQSGVPEAVVGQPYRLFDATAHDAYSGELPVTVKVFRNYNTDVPTQIGIKNGAFTPTRDGVYTVEYSAINAYGIRNRETVNISAINTDDVLKLELGGKKTSGGVGTRIKIADSLELKNAKGASSLNIKATLSSDSNISYEIGEELEFVPYYVGDYTVDITYSDYIFEKTESFVISVTAADGKPYFYENPALPNYIIAGKTYAIPSLNGYVFPSGAPESKACDVFVKEDDGERKALAADGKYTVPAAAQSVAVIYELSDGAKTVQAEYPMNVVNAYESGKLKIERYFKSETDGATSEANDRHVSLTSDKDAEWEFINLLKAPSVEWRIRTVEGASNFERLNFYITDASDEEKTVKITLSPNGNYLDVSINGVRRITVSASWKTMQNNDFSFKYDNRFRMLTVNSGSEIIIDSYMSGEAFDGFESDDVLFRAEMSGVKDKSQIAMMRIDNQILKQADSDTFNPIIYAEAIRGYVTVGDTVTILPAAAGDVLDPFVSFGFKVTDADGNFVTAKDGTVLDGTASPNKAYEIVIEKLGIIDVYYEAKDANRTAKYSYVINSVDMQAPEITIESPQTSGKVGSVLPIAKCSVSDNGDISAVTVFITVLRPDGLMFANDGANFKADLRGEYTVTYMAADSVGNVSTARYTVTVE